MKITKEELREVILHGFYQARVLVLLQSDNQYTYKEASDIASVEFAVIEKQITKEENLNNLLADVIDDCKYNSDIEIKLV